MFSEVMSIINSFLLMVLLIFLIVTVIYFMRRIKPILNKINKDLEALETAVTDIDETTKDLHLFLNDVRGKASQLNGLFDSVGAISTVLGNTRKYILVFLNSLINRKKKEGKKNGK